MALAAAALSVVFVAQGGQDALDAKWREYWESNRSRCDREIDACRKTEAVVVLRGQDGRAITDAACEVRQISSDFVFGCNGLCLGQLGPTNAAYEAKLSEFFNLVTTTFCPGAVEPEPGVCRFAADSREIWRRPPPDRVLAFTHAHGQRMKGQPLVCDRWHPVWAAGQTKEQAEAYYRDWFRRVAERYGGEVWCFDVVNEAFDAPWRTPEFPLSRGDATFNFVDWSFAEAAKVFPKSCRLGINMGIGATDWNRHGQRYFDLCKRICDKGIRLDVIGFQFHLFNREIGTQFVKLEHWHPDMLRESYGRFASLGKPLYINEITIPATILPGEAGLDLQAQIAEDLYRFWFSQPAISGIIWWNLCDGAAWEGEESAKGALVDMNMVEKPVYRRLRNLITHDWRTRLETHTDAQGRISFRGFRGKYEADFGKGRIVRFDIR